MTIKSLIDFLKVIFLMPREWAYTQAIRRSRKFDDIFYRTQKPDNPLVQWFPIRHFVVFGERNGLWPNERFCPAAYLRYNLDVSQLSIPPFRHFIDYGYKEQRLAVPLGDNALDKTLDEASLVPLHEIRTYTPSHRLAAVVHIFFYDLWPELRDALGNIPEEFDLICTITLREDYEELRNEILFDFPHARVIPFPNHGRDLFPFTYLCNSGLLENYEAICKLHTKKSLHRLDGDKWRDHLVGSILPSKEGTRKLLEKFLADPQVGFLVADGQIFSDEKWWGSNQARLQQELLRIGLNADDHSLRFAAGSIYWVKPEVLRPLRWMGLEASEFEVEAGQLDGTLAHGVERVLGFCAQIAGKEILQVTELLQKEENKSVAPEVFSNNELKYYALYLPQFHPIPENDATWGPGFTEWSNVVRSKPNFNKHIQPRLPADLGFYDLRLPEVMGHQASLAKSHGIDGFCVYFYWFEGRRLLEQPIDNLLNRPDIDFPFFFCWANERWTKAWDGLADNVVVEQTYSPGLGTRLAADLAKYFADPRYIRVDGAPKFVVYRPTDIPDVAQEMLLLREKAAELGFPKIELGAALFHLDVEETADLADVFDFFVEIPPHGLVTQSDFLVGGPEGQKHPFRLTGGFQGLVYDYNRVVANSLAGGHIPDRIRDKVRRGVMLGWDNTPRRGKKAHISFGCNPDTFERWLRDLSEQVVSTTRSQPAEIYLNAWNEWAEGAHLEPDAQYGSDFLAAVMKCRGKQNANCDTGAKTQHRASGKHPDDKNS
jgi:lipopolysaccharide biosynthesis protein